jgi:hypothetical protein
MMAPACGDDLLRFSRDAAGDARPLPPTAPGAANGRAPGRRKVLCGGAPTIPMVSTAEAERWLKYLHA